MSLRELVDGGPVVASVVRDELTPDQRQTAELGELLDRHGLPEEAALEQAVGRGGRQADLAEQLDRYAGDLSGCGVETLAIEAMTGEKDSPGSRSSCPHWTV